MKVKISEIIGSMELYGNENRSFLNLKSGEIITMSSEDIELANRDYDDDQIPKWQKDFVITARELDENFEDYVELPDKYEIDEYNIMIEFCASMENEKISDAFYEAIRGKGAFRRFKDNLYNYNIEDKWYAFYNEALREVAIEWCNDNDIEYE